MQSLNYCRNILKDWDAGLLMTPTLPTPLKEEMDVIAREYVYDLRKAVKFQLPFMGKFFEDHEFRGLDGVGEIQIGRAHV